MTGMWKYFSLFIVRLMLYDYLKFIHFIRFISYSKVMETVGRNTVASNKRGYVTHLCLLA